MSEGRIISALRDEVTTAEVRLEEERAAHTSTQRTAAAREQVNLLSCMRSKQPLSCHDCVQHDVCPGVHAFLTDPPVVSASWTSMFGASAANVT